MLDGVGARLIEQFLARRGASFGRTRLLEEIESSGEELQARRGIQDRCAKRPPGIRWSKVICALPGFERFEPISAHLLGKSDIGDSLPILRPLCEGLENSQCFFGIAPIQLEVTDSSLNLGFPLGGKLCQTHKSIDGRARVGGIGELQGQRFLQDS